MDCFFAAGMGNLIQGGMVPENIKNSGFGVPCLVKQNFPNQELGFRSYAVLADSLSAM